jgi:hypothetical protein
VSEPSASRFEVEAEFILLITVTPSLPGTERALNLSLSSASTRSPALITTSPSTWKWIVAVVVPVRTASAVLLSIVTPSITSSASSTIVAYDEVVAPAITTSILQRMVLGNPLQTKPFQEVFHMQNCNTK